MTIPYPTDDVIHIYSIHAWKYGERRKQLHDLLAASWIKGVDYHDLSVPIEHPLDGDNAREIGYELIERIQKSDVVLILAGMYLVDRFWMEFEIIVAFALGKPIIPIAYNGQVNIPEMARRFMSCEEPVRWRSASVIDEILAFMSDRRQRAFHYRRQRADELADMVAAMAPRPRRGAWSDLGALETPSAASYFPMPPALPPQRGGLDWAFAGALALPTLPARNVLDALGTSVTPPPSPHELADALIGVDPLRDIAPRVRRTPNALADALAGIDPLAPMPEADLSWLDDVLDSASVRDPLVDIFADVDFGSTGVLGAIGRSRR